MAAAALVLGAAAAAAEVMAPAAAAGAAAASGAAAPATQPPLADCRTAIAEAARTHGVAEEVLLAIGTVESGLQPWVINANGQPRLYDSHAAAVAGTGALRAAGVESIDVGCMQVNLRWHPTAFATLAEAFDPRANADYAARYLLALFRQTGSWPAAMASYHSGQPSGGGLYACQVQAQIARLQGQAPPPCAATLDLGPAVAAMPASRVHLASAGGPRTRIVSGAELRLAATAPADGIGDPAPAARSAAASSPPDLATLRVAPARTGRGRVVRGRGPAIEAAEAQAAPGRGRRLSSRVIGGRQ